MKKRIPGQFHPGIYIDEERLARDMSVTELALAMEIRPAQLRGLRKGEEPVYRAIAEKLANVFGTSAEVWLNLQRAFDEAEER